MNNRSIIRSSNNMKGQSGGKKVHVQVVSCITRTEEDEQQSEKENGKRFGSHKEIPCDGAPNKEKDLSKGQNSKISLAKGSSLNKSCSTGKGCLKRDLEEHRESLDCEEIDAKSSKSIKFNINHNDVFEYSNQDSRKKIIPFKKTEQGSNSRLPPSSSAEPIDGECCQIW